MSRTNLDRETATRWQGAFAALDPSDPRVEGGYHRHHFLRFDNTDTMLMGRFVWHGENRQVQIQTTIDSMHLVLIRAAGADVDALPVSIDTANRGPAR